MAAVDIGARVNSPINDDLDNLFNYDVDGDLFNDVDTNMEIMPKQAAGPTRDRGPLDGGLGLDEEIKVKRKRHPIPKLDADKLLSQNGISKLRRITKERLRFKGKGHEFSDIARLLNLYQLWLDDLYPRAKFADGLAMIEKLGHSKRMQVMRKEWINESKARQTASVGDDDKDSQTAQQRSSGAQRSSKKPETLQSRRRSDSQANDATQTGGNRPAIEDKPRSGDASQSDSLSISDGENAAGGPPEDELDAILAEEGFLHDALPTERETGGAAKTDIFADDEEAMDDI